MFLIYRKKHKLVCKRVLDFTENSGDKITWWLENTRFSEKNSQEQDILNLQCFSEFHDLLSLPRNIFLPQGLSYLHMGHCPCCWILYFCRMLQPQSSEGSVCTWFLQGYRTANTWCCTQSSSLWGKASRTPPISLCCANQAEADPLCWLFCSAWI